MGFSEDVLRCMTHKEIFPFEVLSHHHHGINAATVMVVIVMMTVVLSWMVALEIKYTINIRS